MSRTLSLCLLVLSLLCSGCSDALYWYGRTVYGVDCSPQVVQAHNGYCVYVKDKQGEGHAETPRP
jgi:hypothetical protein